MKKLFDKTMEIITPCFCTGAERDVAEIRAPSIRGELRWWFRALDGTREQEAEAFGSIKGSNGKGVLTENRASILIVRVSDLRKTGKESRDIPENLQFFLKSRLQRGNNAMVPAGWSFHLQILQKQTTSCDDLIDLTIRSFSTLGSIGLRSNWGLGAFQTEMTKLEFDHLKGELQNRGFDLFDFPVQSSARDALDYLEEQIRTFRERQGIPKNSKNAMGFIQDNNRHASCLRRRPVALDNGKFLPTLIYSEAPLGEGVKSIQSELKAYFA
jgi:CRISPR type III-B/RAMP module RAMP protein Cmr1